jgi:hypothetical protein
MSVRVLLSILAAFLAGYGAARAADVPAGFREAPKLEPAASYVAGKPVSVYCGKLPSRGVVDGDGLAVIGGDRIYISSFGCYLLEHRAADPGFDLNDAVAHYLLTLAHEAIHTTGEADESVTDCTALKYLPGMATRFFAFKRWSERHELMQLAWDNHRRKPDAYTRLC